MSSIRVVDALPIENWRAFIEGNSSSNIFHTPELFEVFARTEGYHPGLWAAVDSDNCPLAMLLPVKITLFDGILRSFSTRSIAYGSIVWEPSDEGFQALDLLLSTYALETRASTLFTELRNLTDVNAAQSLLNLHGFRYQDHLNFLIDLSRPPETLLMSIGPRTRKNIRRALRRSSLTIEELDRAEQLPAWYAVLQKTYRRARVPLAELSLFQAAFEVLFPKNMIRFTQARSAAAVVATSVELLYRDRVFGWYGGLDRELAPEGANELLTWKILSWGAENSYSIYDFGGAGLPGHAYGPRDFKAKFGGRLVNYGRNVLTGSAMRLQISNFAYEVYRRFL